MGNTTFTDTAQKEKKEIFFFIVLKVSFNSKLENNFYKVNLVHRKNILRKNEQS